MTDDANATLVVEQGCDRRCRVEVDLTGWRTRLTYGQMLGRAETAHKAAHRADPPARVFVHGGDATVRAGAL
jgi:hypothetical protein